MATVQVILKEKITKLGAEADVVSVKAGYARNFLIPHGKAYEATKGNLLQVKNLKAKRAEREAKEISEAQTTAGKIKKLNLKLELATSQAGKAFGAITNMDIAKALEEQKIIIDRHCIELDKPIKGTGKFDIQVRLHADVEATLHLTVTAAGGADVADDSSAG
jgi:large subunit ribosomal protein L9